MPDSQFRKTSDGRSWLYGFVPKISIDPRVNCFQQDPPPQPITEKDVQIALVAAQLILSAVWEYRQYIEVVKISFFLPEFLSNSIDKHILAELVITIPTIAEKLTVSAHEHIAGRARLEEQQEMLLNRLAHGLAAEARKAVASKQKEVDIRIRMLKQFEATFEAPLE